MHLRRLAAHEAGLHRAVRLRALREAPDSFGETFAVVAARHHAYWEDLTRSVTDPGRHVMFLAWEGEDVLGSTYGTRDGNQHAGGRVGGMWVDPEWRGRGVGGLLLRQVFSWAQEEGLIRLRLWAPLQRPAALALYARAGFRENGKRRPLPVDPALQIVEMEAPV